MVKVVFIQNIRYEQLGIAYLSSLLKAAGHKVELFIVDEEKDFLRSLRRTDPTLVAFSCTTGVHVWVQQIARLIKRTLRCLIVMGGAHPTFFPEIINNPDIDIICRGEGESSLLELANRLSSGCDYSDIPGLWVKRDGQIIKNDFAPLEENLDKISFPDREIYYRYNFFRINTVRHFITGRGCPFKCTYCFNAKLKELLSGKGHYIRQRSVENVISELVMVRDNHRLKTVYFQDDTLFLNPKWTIGFLNRYRDEVRVPFICNTKLSLLKDDLIEQLKDSFCYSVQFGIETGNEEYRRMYLKRNDTNEQIIETGRKLKKAGIRFLTYNMLGLPGETLENAWETMRINAVVKTDFPRVSLFQPYPGTELGEYAVKLDFAETDFSMDRMDETYFRSSVIKQPNIKEIQNLQKLSFLAIRFYYLKPLLNKLIKLPLEKFYYFIFLLSLVFQYSRATRRSLHEILLFSFGNLSFFKLKKSLLPTQHTQEHL